MPAQDAASESYGRGLYGQILLRRADAARPPRPADQITWEALAKMYQEDVAADANRPVKHWR